MKRRVLIILLLLCCSIGYADVQNTDVHLLKLVQAINDSDYIGIKREIPLVENWYYDKWNEKAWIEKIHVAFEFLESDETKDIEPHLLDSLWLYAGAEMEQRGNDYLSLDWTEENFREAIYNYEIAASIYREILGEQEPAYHSLLSKIAIYYSEIGQKIQSALYQIEYLKIQIRISTEPNHVLYSNLAENYEYVFDFKQAEMCYLQALSILEDQSMIHSKEYAKCLQLFANMYIDLGDYEKAVYYILQAIPIREELYGTHSMEYAIPVMTLAIIYGRLEDIPMQRKYTEIAASIYNNLYGEESREYANALIALADLYMHEKDTTKTILALEKSISILKHHSDEESRMELAIALSNLGLIHT